MAGPPTENPIIQNLSVSEWALAKLASVWGLVGIGTWSDFAAFLAVIYSLLIIWQNVYKNYIKPTAQNLKDVADDDAKSS